MNDRLKLIGQLKFVRDYECKTDAEITAMNDVITALSTEPQVEIDMAYMRGRIDGIKYCTERLRKMRMGVEHEPKR